MDEIKKAATEAAANETQSRHDSIQYEEQPTANIGNIAENQNDKERIYSIALGKSRFDVNWQNKDVSWAELVRKMKLVKRTDETVEEYSRMSKDDKGKCKDRGGFVGGALARNGARRSDTVSSRSLITLDIDEATIDTVNTVRDALDGSDWCIYSTHSHTPERPRLRLVVPLSRNAAPEEYEPLARLLAKKIGIETVDEASYKVNQLMYWPTCPKDGEFVFETGAGKPLNVECCLAEYSDYLDIEEWPRSEREKTKGLRALSKQKAEDPTMKEGPIGDFCRAYGIHDAIETFLPEVYAPSGENRFTFTKGTTVNGVIVYDDKFLYSHHATDPAGETLCNSFDLIRIHKFGAEDDGADPKTPFNKLPSFKAMTEFVTNDVKVQGLMRDRAIADFAAKVADSMEPDDQTGQALELTVEPASLELKASIEGMDLSFKGNKVKKSFDNLSKLLSKETQLQGKFAYNELSDVIVVTGDLPGCPLPDGKEWVKLNVRQITAIQVHISRVYDLEFEEGQVHSVIQMIAEENTFNPAVDYFNSLRGKWDGKPRVDTLFTYYLGADDEPLTRAVARKFLCAVLARTFTPGVKFDYVPLLVGPEGLGKSSLFQILLPVMSWFTADLPPFDSDSQKLGERMTGKVICESAECVQLKRTREQESVKNFISRTVDTYRPAWGRLTKDYPRRCVFVATTNEAAVLRGGTGNRRFWPVDVRRTEEGLKRIFEILPTQRDQIWAEALKYYDQEEALYLDAAMESQMRKRQQGHNEIKDSILLDKLMELGSRMVPENILDMPTDQAAKWLRGDLYAGAAAVVPSLNLIHMPPLALYKIAAFLGLKDETKTKDKIKQLLDYLGCGEQKTARVCKRVVKGFVLPKEDENESSEIDDPELKNCNSDRSYNRSYIVDAIFNDDVESEL